MLGRGEDHLPHISSLLPYPRMRLGMKRAMLGKRMIRKMRVTKARTKGRALTTMVGVEILAIERRSGCRGRRGG
jgi:hypothetical protein